MASRVSSCPACRWILQHGVEPHCPEEETGPTNLAKTSKCAFEDFDLRTQHYSLEAHRPCGAVMPARSAPAVCMQLIRAAPAIGRCPATARPPVHQVALKYILAPCACCTDGPAPIFGPYPAEVLSRVFCHSRLLKVRPAVSGKALAGSSRTVLGAGLNLWRQQHSLRARLQLALLAVPLWWPG